MSDPVRAADGPFAIDVEAGQRYSWCACGLSKDQPFCDGSHKGGDIRPVRYIAEKSGQLYFCGCKQTKSPPLCDGSHNN